MHKVVRRISFIVGLVSFIAFIVIAVSEVKEFNDTKKYYKEEFKGIVTSIPEIEKPEVSISTEDVVEEISEPSLVLDYQSLLDRNSDCIGWIHSDLIDLPIVQTTNNSYYLNHNFDKQYSKYGAIFLDSRVKSDSNVLLVHGHNNFGGIMFGALKNYIDIGNGSKFFIALSSSNFDFKKFIMQGYIIVHETDELLSPFNFSEDVYKSILSNKLGGVQLSDKIVVLSTCHGQTGTDKRLLIILCETST